MPRFKIHSALASLLLALTLPVCAQDAKPAADAAPKAADEGDIHTVRGNPPADHPFGKVKPGMKFDEALAILGKPTSERSYCTGKHRIPFYMGRDQAYTEYYYQGQGKIYFYTEVSTFKMFHGAVHTCSPKAPFELAGVEYNTAESGIAPKEGEDAKKETAEAAK